MLSLRPHPHFMNLHFNFREFMSTLNLRSTSLLRDILSKNFGHKMQAIPSETVIRWINSKYPSIFYSDLSFHHSHIRHSHRSHVWKLHTYLPDTHSSHCIWKFLWDLVRHTKSMSLLYGCTFFWTKKQPFTLILFIKLSQITLVSFQNQIHFQV